MKYLNLFLVLFSILVSCNKETMENKSLLVGKWNWKSSLQNNGGQMLPRDVSVTDTNFLVFNNDNFINNSFCVIGGQIKGNYELDEVSKKQILILKSSNRRSDTFYISITNTQLDLKEVYSNSSWTHTFIKRDK